MIWEIKPRGRKLCVSTATVNYVLICGSGGSAISQDERLIVLSSLADGFECYTLSDQQRIYTVTFGFPESVPTSVLFDLDGSVMFGGSSGAAYVANGMPLAIEQTLKCEGKQSFLAGNLRCINNSSKGDEVVPILVSLVSLCRFVKGSDSARGTLCSFQEDTFSCDRNLWSWERNSDQSLGRNYRAQCAPLA